MAWPTAPRPPRSANLTRELFKGVSFYKRKTVFFGVIFLATVATFAFLGINPLPKKRPKAELPRVEADQSPSRLGSSRVRLPKSDLAETDRVGVIAEAETIQAAELSQLPGINANQTTWNFDAELKNDGRVYVNGFLFKQPIYSSTDFDELRLVVISSAPIFLEKVTLTVKLPKPLPENARPPRIINKIVGSAKAEVIDPQTIVFEGQDVFPKATFTAILELPKGMIEFSPGERLKIEIQKLPALIWMILGGVFPLVGLVVLYRIWRRLNPRLSKKVGCLAKPPDDLPPAMVGAIVSGRIRVREIVATLIDLLIRGYLEIREDQERFIVLRRRVTDRRLWGSLRKFERLLLDELLPGGKPFTTEKLLTKAIGSQLFSRRISIIWWEIYHEATLRGFFLQNPAVLHFRYRAIGLGLFFLGLLGFGSGMIFGVEPKFGLWLWLGVIVLGLAVVSLSARLSARSPQGEAVCRRWLAFANYLGLEKPIEYSPNIQVVFERNLAYALVLEKEKEWAARFWEVPFSLPQWFSSVFEVNDIPGLAEHLFPFIAGVGKQFETFKEPIFE